MRSAQRSTRAGIFWQPRITTLVAATYQILSVRKRRICGLSRRRFGRERLNSTETNRFIPLSPDQRWHPRSPRRGEAIASKASAVMAMRIMDPPMRGLPLAFA
jgi:hypothetical protein